MADEFIEIAVDGCLNELNALQKAFPRLMKLCLHLHGNISKNDYFKNVEYMQRQRQMLNKKNGEKLWKIRCLKNL